MYSDYVRVNYQNVSICIKLIEKKSDKMMTTIKQTELNYNGIWYRIGDLVRTVYPWYHTEPQKQGQIIGFDQIYAYNQYHPQAIIKTETDEIHTTHPGNIEKVDISWLEMC